MLFDLFVPEFKDFLGQTIEEVTVVWNQNQCAIKIFQGTFENVLGAHVEVIGRLIENEQIHRFEQQFDHSQSGPFSSWKHFHFFTNVIATKHERSKHIFNFSPDIAHCHIVDGLKNSQFLVKQRSLVLGKIADHGIVSQSQFSIEINFIHHRFDERWFSFTVFTYECHFFTSWNR